MKKTWLSVIAGLAVINAASAVPSMDMQRTNCEDGQHVWVEKTKTCVPINPCLSDDSAIKDAYCITVFDSIELPWYTAGEWLAESYIKNVLRTKGNYQRNVKQTTHLWGQDYMAYKLQDGGYVVFEFDDLMDESAGVTASHPLGIGQLKTFRADNAIKGAFLAFGYDDGSGIQDDILCENIGALASVVFGVTYNGIFEHNIQDGACKIRLVNVID